MAQQPPVGHSLLIIGGSTITLRHTTLGRTPLDEGSARCRDLYLTTHNIHKRQPPMFGSEVFEQQFQQTRGRRPTPYTARPLGLAVMNFTG